MVSRKEIEILNGNISALCDLANGLREPSTEAQLHFVKAVNGRILPQTDYEKAFMSFLKLTKIQQKNFIKSYREKNEKAAVPLQKVKRPKKRKSEKEKKIERMHRVSGFNSIRASFVRG